jgi:hypothetical protein
LKETENPGPYSEQMRGKETLNNACELGEKGDILCTCLGIRRKRTLDLLAKQILTLDLLVENIILMIPEPCIDFSCGRSLDPPMVIRK